MWQKLPVNGFESIENISEFDESFVRSYNEESDERYFLVVVVEKLHNRHNDLQF